MATLAAMREMLPPKRLICAGRYSRSNPPRLAQRQRYQVLGRRILRPKRQSGDYAATDPAYRSINSKRADFVIADQRGLAVLAVEYHGQAHFQGNADLAMRDIIEIRKLSPGRYATSSFEVTSVQWC